MLIISRKIGESFIINNDIEISILEIKNDKIRIGIEAPKNVKILRKELLETEKSNRDAVQLNETLDFNMLKALITKND